MTTYHRPQPLQQDPYDSAEDTDYDEMVEYDLDVVDDALMNPHNKEFMDHFGFTIHVRTDDEDSSDDDSAISDTEYRKNDKTLKKDNKVEPLIINNSVSSGEATLTSSDDDLYSVDTNIATPSHQKNWSYPHATERIDEGYQSTISNIKSTASSKADNRLSYQSQFEAHQTTFYSVADINRKESEDNARHNRLSTSSLSHLSYETPLNKRSSIVSIVSTFNNPFKRPISVVNIQPPPAVITRPSIKYQQRQSKRPSEANSPSTYIGTPRSSASNHRCFDKLVSKFRRFSHNDHKYDSEKHIELKNEALEELKIYKEQDTEKTTDWDFWGYTLSNFGRVIDTQMDDLRQHLIHGGMPIPIRGYIWQVISKSRDSFDMEIEYREILKKSNSPFEKQIERDLTRTFPNHPFFMQKAGRQSLFNVAKAYSLFDQEVGYCQGLAFIIGCLLLHMSEESAFCVLIKLMGKYGLRGNFTPRMESLHQQMYQFDNVLQQKLPVVHRHLEHEGVTPSMYASQWFITLFSYRCPIRFSFRVIDLLLIEGTQVLVQIALALIIRNQDKILKLQFEALIQFLCNEIFYIFEEDDDSFVEDVYRVDLPARFMARLAHQFTGEEARESKSISQEDNLRRINGQLSEHIRSIEGSLRTMEIENKELTTQVISSKMEMASKEDEKQHARHELLQLRTEFDNYRRNICTAYDKQLQELNHENHSLAERNLSLVEQLSDTEDMLIKMKLELAEKEIEFDSLRRQIMKFQKYQK
ncbi:rab-GTPase-TBC domain-containing protein [Pilobolus umbonatus]|nr:rab-GTPase-TBC domain-containing protein [Pilobolus umbonatus]